MITLFGKPEPTLLERLKESVGKTRSQLASRVEELLTGERQIDPQVLRELETALLAADLGVRTTKEIIASVRDKVERHALTDAAQLKAELKNHLMGVLRDTPQRDGAGPNSEKAAPHVIFIVGVNGTGKTTTIGKLANRLRKEGRSVLLCAADTFRAAAIEQLDVWAGRVGVEVIKQKPGADPAAVVFDALSAARARNVDAVIVDTAGRLHTKSNLMAELEKMKRTAAKLVEGAPHDIWLVMDATTGQNALQQARAFKEAVDVTGVILAKLDSSARGGMAFAIQHELGLPILFAGLGEGADDLEPFDPDSFIEGILAEF